MVNIYLWLVVLLIRFVQVVNLNIVEPECPFNLSNISCLVLETIKITTKKLIKRHSSQIDLLNFQLYIEDYRSKKVIHSTLNWYVAK